jgi:putative alpha-1,2-mannosidase
MERNYQSVILCLAMRLQFIWHSVIVFVSRRHQLLARIGISTVDTEGAGKNLLGEIAHWDFEKVRAEARNEWRKELSRISVSGRERKGFIQLLYLVVSYYGSSQCTFG